MKKYLLIALFIFSLLLLTPFVIAEGFVNNVKSISFDKNSAGNLQIKLNLDKDDSIKVLQKGTLEYSIIMPETSNGTEGKPSFGNASDLIEDVEITTQPYKGNIRGYTKIIIKTKEKVKIIPVVTVGKEHKASKSNKTSKYEKDEKNNIKNKSEKIAAQSKNIQKTQEVKRDKNEKANSELEYVEKNQVENFSAQPQDISETLQNKIEEENKIPLENSEDTEDIDITAQINNPKNKTNSMISSFIITIFLLLLLAYVHHYNKIRMDMQLAKKEAEAKEEILNFQTNTFGKDFLFHEDSGHNIIIEKEKPVKKDVPVQNPIKDSVKSDTSVEIEQAIENSLQKEFAETVNVIEDMPLENPIISEPIAETFEEIQPLPDFETDLQESFGEIVTNNIEEKIETDIDIPKLNEDDMLVNADINRTLQEEDSDYELEQYIDSIEFEDVVDKDFGKDILPEEVFGNVDDETELQKIAKLDINRKDDREVLKNNEEQNNFNANSKKTITIPNVGEYNIRPVKALELKGKKDQIETQEVIKEEPVKNSEKTDKDIIKGSFDLTPTKALYLVDYENSTILMAGIKDNYIVLKNFEKIIDKPFFVRQTEKTSKKANYIVKVGDFRGIVSVTLKNVELALEL